jgi:CHAD domain-containing protein
VMSNERSRPDGQTGGSARGAEPYRRAMRSLIGQRWGAVWKAVPVALEGTDPEGVHDVRVASRRLRAAMDVAASAFPPSWYKPLHRAAKEITGALGEVRDRDVLLQAIVAERDAAPAAERPGIIRLIDRIERERAAARIEMEHFLRTLIDSGLAEETVARFGPEAKPPKILTAASAAGQEEAS